jgi:hypothetical protein
MSNTSNKERDEGSKNKVRTKKQKKNYSHCADTKTNTALSQSLKDDIKNPFLPCESLHPGFHSLVT